MVVAIVKTPKAKVRSGVRRMLEGIAERDEGIVEMRDEGANLSEIADVAKMSIEGVRKALHRRGKT